MISIEQFLKKIQVAKEYQNQIVHIEELPAKAPIYKDIDVPLSKEILKILKQDNIDQLFSHQVDAIQAIRRGENVVIATSTSSGKTLCYTIPILENYLNKPEFYALFIFPLKALAQNQLEKFRKYMQAPFSSLRAEIYDGDLNFENKRLIRRNLPQIILTNPDEIHHAILPHHAQLWSHLFKKLKYIVADEVHTYRGVFGSNVANIFRRLLRIAEFYGANPQIICCSATIANPEELASKLFGRDFELIDNDGALRGSRKFVFWNPPLLSADKITGDKVNVRKSAYSEGEQLFLMHVIYGFQNITFTRARKMAELLLRWAQRDLNQMPHLSTKITAYRAGYFPAERREIEKKLFSGELLGVLSTNALELGIDVGQLDACILIGYPGTVSSTWQQAGRAGRRDHEALITLIGSSDPLDQYFMNHPEDFFKKSAEHTIINPFNSYIVKDHILCAAYEKPLTLEDKFYFGNDFEVYLEALVKEGYLKRQNGQWLLTSKIVYPAKDVKIRSASKTQVKIFETTSKKVLGTIEYEMALKEVHPNAIYLHLGKTYFVEDLDTAEHIAYVKKVDLDSPYYTEPLINVEIRIKQEKTQKPIGIDALICFGEVQVTESVHNWVEIDEIQRETLAYGEGLNLPPIILETKGFWIKPSDRTSQTVDQYEHDLAGGLHAIEHAAIAMLPLLVMCDRRDLGGLSATHHIDTNSPAIFVYDSIPGGIGLAEKGYAQIEELLTIILKAIKDCPCSSGCPSCIQSSKCSNGNEPLDKEAALIILHDLLGLDPYIPEVNIPKKPSSAGKARSTNVKKPLKKRVER